VRTKSDEYPNQIVLLKGLFSPSLIVLNSPTGVPLWTTPSLQHFPGGLDAIVRGEYN